MVKLNSKSLVDINSTTAGKIVEIIAQNPKIKYGELWQKVKAGRITIAKAQFNVLLNDLKLTNTIQKNVAREYYL